MMLHNHQFTVSSDVQCFDVVTDHFLCLRNSQLWPNDWKTVFIVLKKSLHKFNFPKEGPTLCREASIYVLSESHNSNKDVSNSRLLCAAGHRTFPYREQTVCVSPQTEQSLHAAFLHDLVELLLKDLISMIHNAANIWCT